MLAAVAPCRQPPDCRRQVPAASEIANLSTAAAATPRQQINTSRRSAMCQLGGWRTKRRDHLGRLLARSGSSALHFM